MSLNTCFSKNGLKGQQRTQLKANLTCNPMILWCKEGEAPPEVVVVLGWQFLQKYSELLQLLWQVFFPTRKHSFWMNMHETPIEGLIIRIGAIYAPCCFKPVTVEVKCHQRFRKFSQVTLQGSYQRPMMSLYSEFKLLTLFHVTNTSLIMLDFTSKATRSYEKRKESHQPQREGPCWTRCGPLFLGPSRFSASSPPKLRLPDGTDPGGQDPPRLQHQDYWKGT